MKHRAVVVGVEVDGHAVQTLTNSTEEVMAWAHAMAVKYDTDVRVYQSYERVLTTVRKPYVRGREAK
jgi:hypothetical protein